MNGKRVGEIESLEKLVGDSENYENVGAHSLRSLRSPQRMRKLGDLWPSWGRLASVLGRVGAILGRLGRALASIKAPRFP